ncbi:MAG: hypothetical protein WAK96_03155 [Desulfobaccales bacterium]
MKTFLKPEGNAEKAVKDRGRNKLKAQFVELRARNIRHEGNEMRILKFKVFLGVTFSLLCLLIITSRANAQAIKTTVGDILSNPDQYDGKMVQVEAKVLAPQFKTSKKGNAFTTFKLEGDGKILSVFSYGTLSINGGDSVRVIGRYQKLKKVGPYTFSNEIDASRGSVEKL